MLFVAVMGELIVHDTEGVHENMNNFKDFVGRKEEDHVYEKIFVFMKSIL